MKFPTTIAELKQIIIDIWRPSIDSFRTRIKTLEEEVNQIELDLKLKSNLRYKEFSYSGDNLVQQLIYEDNTLTTLVYTVNYTYTGDNLTEIEVIRASDGFVYTKTLTYDINDVLESIDII